MHGDHFFGLLGLLSTFKLNNRTAQLNIFVPKNEKKQLETLIKLTIYDAYPSEYKINIIEAEKGLAFEDKEIKVEVISLDHTTRTNGYIFKVKDKVGKFNKAKALKLNIPEGPLFSDLQKGKTIKLKGKTIKPEMVMDYKFKKIGKRIAYLADTAILKVIPKELLYTDILIHECTFFEEDREKAKAVKHSVAEDIPAFAKKAKVKQLFLIHISSKYNDLEKREKDLQKKAKSTGIKPIIIHGLKEIGIDDY